MQTVTCSETFHVLLFYIGLLTQPERKFSDLARKLHSRKLGSHLADKIRLAENTFISRNRAVALVLQFGGATLNESVQNERTCRDFQFPSGCRASVCRSLLYLLAGSKIMLLQQNGGSSTTVSICLE